MLVTFPQTFVFQSFEVEDDLEVTASTQAASGHLERDLNILRSVLRRLRGSQRFDSLEDDALIHLGGQDARTARQGALFFWFEGVNRVGEPMYRVSPTRPASRTAGVRFYPQYPFDGEPVTVTFTTLPHVTLIRTNTWLGSPLTSARTQVVSIMQTQGYTFVPK